MNAEQVHAALAGMLETVPHVVGVNNHEGSRATSDPALMAGADARAARARPLLHRQPHHRSHGRLRCCAAFRRAGRVAQSLSRRHADAGSRSWRNSTSPPRDAIRDGSAIAIGHPHPATIAALAQKVRLARGAAAFGWCSPPTSSH